MTIYLAFSFSSFFTHSRQRRIYDFTGVLVEIGVMTARPS